MHKPRNSTIYLLTLFATLLFTALVSSGFFAIVTTKASTLTPEQIQEKNLIAARKQLKQGNVTGAIGNILTILEWEFKDVHPKLAEELNALNATTMHGGSNTTTSSK